jgi:predicted nucleotidyltransferase component of viral defense system
LGVQEASEWAQTPHLIYLNALTSSAEWSAEHFAFYGGTSLHLSWNSIRYSEDLDFLLSREAASVEMRMVLANVGETFRALDPNFNIKLKELTKNPKRLLFFQLRAGRNA